MSRVSRFLNQWRTRALDREFQEELRFHLQARIDANLRRGLSPAEADAEARRHLGSTLRAREGMREARAGGWADSLAPDCRQAVRGLRRHPAFPAAAVLMLALGVGATTSIFAVVHGVLIKPLPYPEPDTIVRIVHDIGGIEQQFFSDAIYLAYVENARAFEEVGVWSPAATATITGQGDPEEVRALRASRGVLTTLGVRPAVGRWFSVADDTPRAPDVVIITAGYWQRRFGGEPDVLERTLAVDGRPHQIVGVMPPHFRFSRDFDIVLPLRIDSAAPGNAFRLVGVARLRPGVTPEQANGDVSRILDIVFSGNPAVRARWSPMLVPLERDVVGDVGTTLWVLLGAITVVLLMACANVANLLLIRADARRDELAIRAALGATVGRVARQLLVESLTLALLGGVVGIAFAYAGVRALVAMAPANLPRLPDISIDPVVLGFALAVSIVSGLLFGMMPIVKHARPRLGLIFGASRTASLTPERQRSQQTLVAAQIALALVLLVSAGLMVRSVQALRSVDPGFTQPASVQMFSISIPPTLVAERERVALLQQEVLAKIEAIPGVASAAFTTRVPMGSPRFSSALLAEGDVVDDRGTPPNRHARLVSPGAFRTFGTPLVAGRDFTWTDVYSTRTVAIVSENLAREMWGAPQAALGKRVREYYDAEAPWWEIVGVVGDVHDDGVDQVAPPTIYWPAQPRQRLLGSPAFQARRVSVAVRSERAGTESLLRELGEAVWSVSPTLPLAEMTTLDESYRQSMARTSFTLALLAIAGAMALLLALAGIYGVIAYAVAQRRREIGIRLALGAPPRQIAGAFLRRGVVIGGVGLVTGIAGAAGTTRVMRSLLFGITPFDPLTFLLMATLLAAAAVLASYLPARRALAIDPIDTMRAE